MAALDLDAIRERIGDRRVVASVSGGKDSIALLCWLIRMGLDPIAIACDTGWEWHGWRAYLDEVERILNRPIVIVSGEGFIQRTRRTGTFPSRVRRWCTPELKIEPFAMELDRLRDSLGCDAVVATGIRADEGNGRGDKSDRATWPEWEWFPDYDADMWRPLIAWSLADVLAEHHRAGVPVNPLYHLGAERVGCWPCINAGKLEIRLVAEHDPERIDLIRQLEAEAGFTMFTIDRRTEKARTGEGPSVRPMPIDEAVAWSKTSTGGGPADPVCAAFGMHALGPVRDSSRHGGAVMARALVATDVPCPRCAAAVGYRCTGALGQRGISHAARETARNEAVEPHKRSQCLENPTVAQNRSPSGLSVVPVATQSGATDRSVKGSTNRLAASVIRVQTQIMACTLAPTGPLRRDRATVGAARARAALDGFVRGG